MKSKTVLPLLLSMLFLLCSCSTDNFFDKFSSKSSEEESSETAREERKAYQEAPKVFYVASPNLRLYSKPSFSNNYMAELRLNDKVVRHRLEKGFAYVEVARTGQKGWVDNAKLDWKEAATGKETTPEKAKASAAEEASRPDEAEPKAGEAYAAPPPEETPSAETPTSEQPPDEQPRKADPSVFDSM
jgi:hypothetical protein